MMQIFKVSPTVRTEDGMLDEDSYINTYENKAAHQANF